MAQTSDKAMAAAPAWLDQVLQVATSHTALTIYAVVAAVVFVGLTLNIARGQRNEILGPSPFRGRASTRQRQIRERLALLVDQKTSVLGKLLLNFFAVILFGLLVPSAVLALGLCFFDWLVPGAQALAGSAKVSLAQAVSFLGAQFTMGTDTHAPQPGHPIVAWAVIVYRYFLGAFVLMALHLLFGIFRVSGNSAHQIEVCRKLLADAPPAPLAQAAMPLADPVHDDHHDAHAAHGHDGHADDHGKDHGHAAHDAHHDAHADDHGNDHGHGHDDHGHKEEAHGAHGHGHDDHHDDKAHGDDHGHDDHGAHGHDDHGHGHDDHGHHDKHGHKEPAHAHH